MATDMKYPTIVGIQRTKYNQQLGKCREDFTEKVILARATKGSVVGSR